MSRVCVTLKIPMPLKKNFKLWVNSFLILYANRLEIQISSILIKAKLKNKQRFCLLHLFSYDSTDCCRGNRLSKIKLILPSQHCLKYNKKSHPVVFISRKQRRKYSRLAILQVIYNVLSLAISSVYRPIQQIDTTQTLKELEETNKWQ